jgi:predicted Zn-dependent protease
MQQWTEEQMKSLIDDALKASSAGAAAVRIRRVDEGATRYANSEITQNVVHGDVTCEIEAAFDNKVGRCETNRLDRQSIAACVQRAEAIARVAPPDPEHMPPVAPSIVADTNAWFPATADYTPSDRACAIGRAVGVAERETMSGAGVFRTRGAATAFGNSAGHATYHEATDAAATFSATSPSSVGWAEGRSRDVAELSVERVAARAIEKAREGRSPRDIEPGRYEVILEPAALGELLFYFFWYQMDAKATDEGRTFLTAKRGRALAAPLVNLYSDPTQRGCATRPFDADGMPLHRVDWFKEGVLENLMYSRYWADHQHTHPTGQPTNLIMQGGQATLDEMIASTHRGLLITRFWYIRAVEPMRDLFTGMTRDGTFLIENGRLSGPVVNLRFNESPIRLLENIELLGEQRLTGEFLWMLMPFAKAKEFTFTSTTKF